jgi:hypothetical protein
MPPWRVGLALRGFAAIELPPGTIEARDIGEGDPLLLIPIASGG